MRYLLLIPLLLTSALLAYTQTPDTTRLELIAKRIEDYKKSKQAAIYDDSVNKRYLSRNAYDRYFDRYFTQMQYKRESFTEGNSAALDVNDKTTTLNLTLSHKRNNRIFSVGTAVALSDGAGVIFSGDKPTSGTELFTSFSHLFSSQRLLKYDNDFRKMNYRKRRWILDSTAQVHVYKNPFLQKKLQRDFSKIAASIEKYKTTMTGAANDKADLYQDTINDLTDKLYKIKDDLAKLDNGLSEVDEIAEAIEASANKAAIQQELETPGVTTFRMKWASWGVRYRKDNYSTYDSTLSFSKRIGEQPFDKWTFTASMNFLYQKTDDYMKWKERNFIASFYANGSYSLVRGNNFQRIKEGNLSVLRSKAQNDSVYEFSKPYKLRDVSGKKFKKNWIHTPSLTGTLMFGKREFFGLNLITSGEFQDGEDPVFNLRTGLLFRFKDSEKEKSFVNFELFFAFQDMSDTQKSGKSVWQNKQIGVSANIPFQKVFFR